MTLLDQLCRAALDNPADQDALEFEGQWINLGTLRRVAVRRLFETPCDRA